MEQTIITAAAEIDAPADVTQTLDRFPAVPSARAGIRWLSDAERAERKVATKPKLSPERARFIASQRRQTLEIKARLGMVMAGECEWAELGGDNGRFRYTPPADGIQPQARKARRTTKTAVADAGSAYYERGYRVMVGGVPCRFASDPKRLKNYRPRNTLATGGDFGEARCEERYAAAMKEMRAEKARVAALQTAAPGAASNPTPVQEKPRIRMRLIAVRMDDEPVATPAVEMAATPAREDVTQAPLPTDARARAVMLPRATDQERARRLRTARRYLAWREQRAAMRAEIQFLRDGRDAALRRVERLDFDVIEAEQQRDAALEREAAAHAGAAPALDQAHGRAVSAERAAALWESRARAAGWKAPNPGAVFARWASPARHAARAA